MLAQPAIISATSPTKSENETKAPGSKESAKPPPIEPATARLVAEIANRFEVSELRTRTRLVTAHLIRRARSRPCLRSQRYELAAAFGFRGPALRGAFTLRAGDNWN